MAEGKDTSTSEQEKEPGKRPPWWKRFWGWTGFGEKKLWNWLELLGTLAIPVVVAVAAAWFSSQQSATQTQIEEERAQDEALQAYLDQMSGLLLNKDLRAAEKESEVRTLARARTLTVLGRLDGARKRSVVQFLYEAGLITRGQADVDLAGADLREANLANLFGADLGGADLSGTDLRRAYLSEAYLGEADLSDADLSEANLSEAYLFEADLDNANLSGAILRANLGKAYLYDANLSDADLSEANLIEANLTGANLSKANLGNAFLWDANLGNADLSGANLTGAKLFNANLSGAILSKANLSKAVLDEAHLVGANLSSANLSDATGVTQEQLEEQALTLEGATMPDGSEHP